MGAAMNKKGWNDFHNVLVVVVAAMVVTGMLLVVDDSKEKVTSNAVNEITGKASFGSTALRIEQLPGNYVVKRNGNIFKEGNFIQENGVLYTVRLHEGKWVLSGGGKV